jgi:hypothetical protein
MDGELNVPSMLFRYPRTPQRNTRHSSVGSEGKSSTRSFSNIPSSLSLSTGRTGGLTPWLSFFGQLSLCLNSLWHFPHDTQTKGLSKIPRACTLTRCSLRGKKLELERNRSRSLFLPCKVGFYELHPTLVPILFPGAVDRVEASAWHDQTFLIVPGIRFSSGRASERC